MISSIFLAMPVENIARSITFFEALGFRINPQFTNDESACVVISDNIFAMISNHEKYTSFSEKKLPSKDAAEVIFSLQCESTDEVKSIAEKAFAAGARRVNEPSDQGFMFSWGFEDLDGHLWDLFWMDPANFK
ncbi:MAG: hypothetical protein RL410_1018 [Actinomycetota bacterium]|jgi:predicted lactoylglutathione lyase